MKRLIVSVASYLKIDERLIQNVEVWASVLFVRFQYGSPRFVSKKVVKKVTNVSNKKKVFVKGSEIAVSAPYDPSGEFQKLAKSVNGYRFDCNDKTWNYPLAKAKEIEQIFPAWEYYYTEDFVNLLAELEKEENDKSKNLKELIDSADLEAPLPNGWSLKEHQKEGVRWLLAHTVKTGQKGGILADDMGLGKTLEALISAKIFKSKFNCDLVVICPASVKLNWQKEAKALEVGGGIKTFSWAKFPTDYEKDFILVADESHATQTPSSKRSKEFLELAGSKKCLAVWNLSGTPMPNGKPINLMVQLKAIEHEVALNSSQYQKRYCDAHYEYYGYKQVWNNNGASNLKGLQEKISDCLLRRTKEECLDLDPKTRILNPLVLPAAEAKNYKKEIKDKVSDYWLRVHEGKASGESFALVTINALRLFGSKYKAAAAIEKAKELLDQGDQVVVFTEFLESAKEIHKALGGELLIGGVPAEEREKMVERFQSGKSRVFVGTIRSCGTGITLTAASNVIMVDQAWTPTLTEQAEDRCYRLGTTKPVFCFWLQLGEIDQIIYQAIYDKQETIDIVVGGKKKKIKVDSSDISKVSKSILEALK